jgi:hypothetical protein
MAVSVSRVNPAEQQPAALVEEEDKTQCCRRKVLRFRRRQLLPEIKDAIETWSRYWLQSAVERHNIVFVQQLGRELIKVTPWYGCPVEGLLLRPWNVNTLQD